MLNLLSHSKNFFQFSIVYVQRIILATVYFITAATYFCFQKKAQRKYLLGVSEIAGALGRFAQLLPAGSATTVVFGRHPSYPEFIYSIQLSGTRMGYYMNLIIGPVLLGLLLPKHNTVIYFWHTRFLSTKKDDGEFECYFVRNVAKKKIVFFFLGDDIRSPVLYSELCKRHQLDNFQSYYYPKGVGTEIDRPFASRARVANKFANWAFSWSSDQASHLSCSVSRPPLSFPDHLIFSNFEKFAPSQRLRIVHPYTNPIPKGTQLCRASIKALREEDFDFEYVELYGVSNMQVIEELRKAHICLGAFLQFHPGIVGIEAMASSCVLVHSADPSVELMLPTIDGAVPWMVTQHWQLTNNLRVLLENRQELVRRASLGLTWVNKYSSNTVCEEYVQRVLDNC